MLFKSNRLPGSLKNATHTRPNPAAQKEKAAVLLMLKLYEQMGYQLAGVGQKDLAAGLDFLKDAAEKSSIKFLSANIIKDGKTVFEPQAIIEKNGVKVGFTAVTACDAVYYHRGQFECIPPEKALSPILPELRKKCDFVILFSNLKDQINRKLVKKFPDIDLIIKSGYGQRTYTPLMLGNVPSVMTHPKGKAVGVAVLEQEKTGNKRAKLKNSLFLLTTKYKIDNAVQTEVDEFNRRFARPKPAVKHRPNPKGNPGAPPIPEKK